MALFQTATDAVCTLNALGWASACLLHTDVLYDAVGALSHFTVISVLVHHYANSTAHPPLMGPRIPFACAAILTWATRTGCFLFGRALAHRGDKRLKYYTTRPIAFSVLWAIQSLWVLTNCAPLLLLASTPSPSSDDVFDPLDFALVLCWLVGFLIETVADVQKLVFRSNAKNSGRFITTGLWSLSRHPNYFGEIMLWHSFALLCSRGMPMGTARIAAACSPAFVTFLLLRVSGVPLLEASGQRQWGKDPEYIKYVEGTPVLIPKLW